MAKSAITTRPRPEAEDLPSGRAPRSRIGLRILIGTITALILTAIVFIAIGEENPVDPIVGAGETQRLIGGIRQDGSRLGFSDAPVRVEVFNDMQCVDCREWHLAVVPALIEERVRPGDVQLVYTHVTSTEREANLGFFAAVAAGLQDREWPFIHLFFVNQANVPPGGIDQDFLDSIIAGVLEIDDSQWREDLDSEEVAEAVSADAARAADLKLPLGPAALVTGPVGEEKLTESPTLAEIEAAIERVAG